MAATAALWLTAACTRDLSTAAVPAAENPQLAPATPEVPSAAAQPTAPSTSVTAPAAPSAAGSCANGARFVEDLTVPDGSVFTPGETFDKRWAVRNDGSCDWGPDYRLVPIGENPFDAGSEIALYPARAGVIGEWQIDLRAPDEPGDYLGRWRARAPDGTLFGDEVYVIIVVQLPTATPGPTPSATSSP